MHINRTQNHSTKSESTSHTHIFILYILLATNSLYAYHRIDLTNYNKNGIVSRFVIRGRQPIIRDRWISVFHYSIPCIYRLGCVCVCVFRLLFKFDRLIIVSVSCCCFVISLVFVIFRVLWWWLVCYVLSASVFMVSHLFSPILVFSIIIKWMLILLSHQKLALTFTIIQ